MQREKELAEEKQFVSFEIKRKKEQDKMEK